MEHEPVNLLNDLCKFRSEKQADIKEIEQTVSNLSTLINLCVYRVSRLRRNEKELDRLYKILRSDGESDADMDHDTMELPWHEFALDLHDINADDDDAFKILPNPYKSDAVEDALAQHEWDKETP
jgi:hypothetical protein